MATPRPKIDHHTTIRATAQDLDNIALIASALRAEDHAAFPTRALAIRYALQATTEHLLRLGRLPHVHGVVA